jgi:hypothetical protein
VQQNQDGLLKNRDADVKASVFYLLIYCNIALVMDVSEEEAAPVRGELTLLRVGARHPATGGSYCFIYMSLSPTGPDIQDFPPLVEDI